jgi:peptide/nickel transport system ATP-binding protein
MAQRPMADRGGPAQPLLIVRGLTKHFTIRATGLLGRAAAVQAVDDLNFELGKGETLAIVGESGCGKSTVSRLVIALLAPTSGEIIFDGERVGSSALDPKDYHRDVQMVFQDSYASLNPRLTVEESIAFGPAAHGLSRRDAVARAHELLAAVGLLPRQFARRYPHELSGGQRQRINIARALALRPRLLILDEPVSALDKSVEAQVLNLLMDLKANYGLTYLFISHDLNVVHHVADRVMVMYLGRLAEIGAVDEIFTKAAHPYTRALLASRPVMDRRRRRTEPPLVGDPPNPINPPSGCRFRTRCAIAEAVCAGAPPPPTALADAPSALGHSAACFALIPQGGHSLSPKAAA